MRRVRWGGGLFIGWVDHDRETAGPPPARARYPPGVRAVPAFILALTLCFASACSTECQQLCTAWYDYQRDVCGKVNLDDDRVTCISDYRRSQSSEGELLLCEARIPDVVALRSSGDDRCCDWTVGECPDDAGDDDSAR